MVVTGHGPVKPSKIEVKKSGFVFAKNPGKISVTAVTAQTGPGSAYAPKIFAAGNLPAAEIKV